MLTKRQLNFAATCEERLCRGCEMLTDNAGYCAQATAQTALAYRAMLERLEWITTRDASLGEWVEWCPNCEERKENGHKPDCELAALLKESEGLE